MARSAYKRLLPGFVRRGAVHASIASWENQIAAAAQTLLVRQPIVDLVRLLAVLVLDALRVVHGRAILGCTGVGAPSPLDGRRRGYLQVTILERPSIGECSK